MEQQPPPPVFQNSPPRKNFKRKILWPATVLWALVIFGIPIVIIFKFVLVSVLHVSNRSPDDRFNLQILEVKALPNFFEERVRVQCPNDMDAGIWVVDLKRTGFYEIIGTNGETYYREGNPRGIGSKTLIHATEGFSTCDILFRVTTSSEDTKWHDEEAGTTLDTTLSKSLTVSEVQTNWPGTYPRGSDIPLANLGELKIMLSIK